MTARQGFAHDAVLTMGEDGDERAPGGAITVALCGSTSHEPPCPLAPHHTSASRSGSELTLRLLFATDPENEGQVRALVDEVLARGEGVNPDGVRTTWQLVSSGPAEVRPHETEHAARLIDS